MKNNKKEHFGLIFRKFNKNIDNKSIKKWKDSY